MKVSGIFASGLLVGWIALTTASFAQESAVGEAKDRVKQTPTNPEASLALGRALRRAGHENDALTELRRGQIFAKGDTAIATEWEIARTHIAKRDFGPAMSACKAITKLTNGQAASRVCAAEAHLLWRRGTEALGELAELAKMPSPGADVQFNAKVAEGRARELESNDAAAEAAYREAIRLAPNRPEGHMQLGAMLHRLGKDGLPELRRAVELDAKDPVAQVELARALGSDPGAIAALEKAIAERPTYLEALRLLTDADLAANRLADAKKTATQLLKIAPNDVIAHLAVGRVALAENKYDEAIKEGEAAFKLMPNEAKAKLLIADAYVKKGEIDLALEAYQKAAGLDPLDPTPDLNATYACIAAGRLTSAKAFASRAVVDFPNLSRAWVAQGDALAADGNTKGAKTAYDSARKAKGADPGLIDKKVNGLRGW
jgi:tetratricopeptide (TPR) repeat protein